MKIAFQMFCFENKAFSNVNSDCFCVGGLEGALSHSHFELLSEMAFVRLDGLDTVRYKCI